MRYESIPGIAGAFLATLLLLGGPMGCGGQRDGGQPLARAETVDVTYYYLPG